MSFKLTTIGLDSKIWFPGTFLVFIFERCGRKRMLSRVNFFERSKLFLTRTKKHCAWLFTKPSVVTLLTHFETPFFYFKAVGSLFTLNLLPRKEIRGGQVSKKQCLNWGDNMGVRLCKARVTHIFLGHSVALVILKLFWNSKVAKTCSSIEFERDCWRICPLVFDWDFRYWDILVISDWQLILMILVLYRTSSFKHTVLILSKLGVRTLSFKFSRSNDRTSKFTKL